MKVTLTHKSAGNGTRAMVALAALGIWMGTAASSWAFDQSFTIFGQNFDTNAVGSDAGWSSAVTGPEYTRTVVSNQFTSPGHSMELAQLTADRYDTGYREFAGTTSNPPLIEVSYDVKWVNTGDTNRPYFGWRNQIGSFVGQGFAHDQTAMIVAGNQVFGGGDGIGFFARDGDGTKHTILSFGSLTTIPDNWWHVDVLLHYGGALDRTYDVTVTQLTGGSASNTLTGLAFRNPSAVTPDQVGVVWFDNGDVPDTQHSLFIDNLLVQAVPEPATMPLLAATAFLLFRRRMR